MFFREIQIVSKTRTFLNFMQEIPRDHKNQNPLWSLNLNGTFFVGENKIVNLEEELKVVGENLKALEVAEEKAQLREEEYKKQIRNLSERLKTAESRYPISIFFLGK